MASRPANAHNRRLGDFFKEVLSGKRTILSVRAAKQFLEAICNNPNPAVCVEAILASPAGCDALRDSLRADTSPDFLHASAIMLLRYLASSPALKMLANGVLLQQLLVDMAQPPTLWKALCKHVHDDSSSRLTRSESLTPFAWFAYELLCLPASAGVDVTADVGALLQAGHLLADTAPLEARQTAYKMQHLLQLKATAGHAAVSAVSAAPVVGPGGRHDNDFADFRTIAIFPTADEILSARYPYLRRADDVFTADVRVRTGLYIDNQFRLLRESMLADLREGVQVAMGATKPRRPPLVLGGLSLLHITDSTGIQTSGRRLRTTKCSVVIACYKGLDQLKKLSAKKRLAYLKDHPKFLCHQALGVLLRDKTIFGFASVVRNEDELAKLPPCVRLQFTDRRSLERALQALKTPKDVQFVLVDKTVFGVEPILRRLQTILAVPMERLLLRTAEERAETLAKNDDDENGFQPTARIQKYAATLKHLGGGDGSREIVVPPLPQTKGTAAIILDPSQRDGLVAALTNRLSLIQGPPGTGKSFLGALFVLALFYLTDKRILITTYTNHALDQCLTDLIELGVDKHKMVRLGSRAASETKDLQLRSTQNAYRHPKQECDLMDTQNERMDSHMEAIDMACQTYRKSRVTFEALIQYLDFSEAYGDFAEAFTVPHHMTVADTSSYETVGRNGRVMRPDYLFEQWKNGRNAGIFCHDPAIATSKQHVWQMPKEERLALLHTWEQALVYEQVSMLAELVEQHDKAKDIVDSLRRESDKAALKTRRIIGCTTTGAVNYADLLAAAKPDVVLVEEAGEILECQVLTALGPSIEQVVLIGDHKQLRPKVDCYPLTAEHGGGYDLNVSLFERLVTRSGFPHTTLHQQHRMCPAISVFAREDTYPEMVDAPSTLQRPPLRGLRDRVVFLNHGQPEDNESRVADRADAGATASKSNLFEAQMALACVRYFSQQGYGTKDMVVLTPYLGQLRLLLDLLHQDKALEADLNDLDTAEMARAGLLFGDVFGAARGNALRVSTVDNYQGEERAIVIVSLTRSNDRGDIGFLAAPQRINVMRTRSRDCLVLLGNAATFLASNRKGRETWQPYLASLDAKGHLYAGLPVRCEQHPDTTALLATPDAFLQHCPDGGCARPCGAAMPCGLHVCKRRCHRETDHYRAACTEDVKVTCARNHARHTRCAQRQDPCRTCHEEDEALRRQAARDLELEKARRARQAAYKMKLEALDNEIAHQKRIVQLSKEEEAEQDTLRARQQDLTTAQKAAEALAKKKQMRDNVKKKKTAHAVGAAGGTESAKPLTPSDGPASWLNSNAQDEWEAMKTYQGAHSETMDAMMGMIGLEDVKEAFLDLKSRVDVAARQGVSLDKERFGCVLLGNPGTGKTTVARLLAQFMGDVGIVAGTYFEETTGAALANKGVPGCQALVDGVLEKGGGVVFIDEAYQLTSGNSSGGGAVLDYLLPEVENRRGQIVFLLAGYSREMESFFAHNPGLPSRFPTELRFNDYTDEELLPMLALKVDGKLGAGRMQAEGGWKGLYCRIVARRVGRGRGRPGFGNARALENALDGIYKRQARRLRLEQSVAGKAGKAKADKATKTISTTNTAKETNTPETPATDSSLLLTKEDLIGPEPQQALQGCKAWQKLQQLVGLGAVKEAVRALMNTVQQNYARELDEAPLIEYSLNKLFLGGPGTGKTTVAKLYGAILVDLGLLSKGEVIVKNPADFVGAALGGSEKLTKGILAATEGKVLVIDEAYGLYGGGGKNSGSTVADPYKTAVVDTIVAEVQSVPGDDRCVLLLGYREQMETMLQNVNPGLSRRFPLASAFEFEDFNDDDLRAILARKLKQQGFTVTDQAGRVVAEMLSRARNRANFGNAGEVDILLGQAKARQQRRLTQAAVAALSSPSSSGAPQAPSPARNELEAVDFDENFDRADRTTTDVKRLFADTVGQEAVVAKLEAFQVTVRALRALDMDPRETIPFAFLFCGPPGTGKTTTAEKIGQVFYDLGFLDTAAVEQCSVTDLVGQYVGQTGPKVVQQLDRALGRVLFIDEAYRLNGSQFAKEATDELVDALTKPRYHKRLVVILAGYTRDVDQLLATNPGLASRFAERVDFRALAPAECVALLDARLRQQQAQLRDKSKAELRLDVLDQAQPSGLHDRMVALFAGLAQQNNWGSARDVGTLARGIFNEAIRSSGSGSGQDKTVVVTEKQIEGQLQAMLDERRRQTANQARPSLIDRFLGAGQPQTHEQDPLSAPSQDIVQEDPPQETPPPDEEKEETPPVPTAAVRPAPTRATRDAGVSDDDWEQLQRDQQAMEARQRDYERLKKEAAEAAKAADDTADAAGDADREARRQAIITQLIEAEEQQKREAEMQRRLAVMGMCPAGFNWVPQEGGWKCVGGSHFVRDMPDA